VIGNGRRPAARLKRRPGRKAVSHNEALDADVDGLLDAVDPCPSDPNPECRVVGTASIFEIASGTIPIGTFVIVNDAIVTVAEVGNGRVVVQDPGQTQVQTGYAAIEVRVAPGDPSVHLVEGSQVSIQGTVVEVGVVASSGGIAGVPASSGVGATPVDSGWLRSMPNRYNHMLVFAGPLTIHMGPSFDLWWSDEGIVIDFSHADGDRPSPSLDGANVSATGIVALSEFGDVILQPRSTNDVRR
jgi:hypothetical protein